MENIILIIDNLILILTLFLIINLPIVIILFLVSLIHHPYTLLYQRFETNQAPWLRRPRLLDNHEMARCDKGTACHMNLMTC